MTIARREYRDVQAKLAFLFMFSIAGIASAGQDEIPAIAHLRNRITEFEAQWMSCSVEIIETSWPTNSIPVARSVDHHLLLDGLFREHILTPSDIPSAEPQMTIHQWDGDKYLVIKPNELVDCRDSLNSEFPPPASQPYGVVLSILGFTGRLSEFLNDEVKGVLEVQVSLAETERGLPRIKRMSRLPSGSKWEVIEVELDDRHGLRLVSGRCFTFSELDGTEAVSRTVVVAFPETIDDGLIRYNVNVARTREPSKGGIGAASTLRVSVERLEVPTIPDNMWVHELTGNPIIRKRAGHKVVSESCFYPEELDRGRQLTANELWLLINDVLLIILATVWGLRRVRRVPGPAVK